MAGSDAVPIIDRGKNPVRTYRSTAFVAVLAAGLVLTQQACTPLERKPADAVAFKPPTSAPPSASAPATAPDATGDPILAGKRQIVIKPNPSFEEIVAVDEKGRLGLTDGEAPKGLFVLTPVGDKFQIKTATVEAGGEPSCMGIKSDGSRSLTVAAAPCDTGRAGQLFTITKQKATDSEGLPTYAISNDSAFLQVFPSGLIAEELGDAPLKTTYSFVDNGPSTLPALD
jgi:hypothetical protein